ncbi:Exocyst complex component SEC8 [Candida viswanathii]|uniref:Exocyst complex component Sec8 n=1 Tax=Candida viswanathii TaxID=5486 RepID=A0A367XXC2_9ASCO|nr:Exocyst complex component SEC8 [Candida viswanathii]
MSLKRLSYMSRNGDNEARTTDESIYSLKEIYNTIKYDWPQMLRDEANPIDITVALLDDTSVGLAHKLNDFHRLKSDTESALKYVVSEKHHMFHSTINSYNSLLATMKESQNDSAEIKEFLESSNKEIHDRSAVLGELSQASGKYAEMIEVLDAMAEMDGIPGRVEQLIADKKIHEVYDLLEDQSNKLFDMIIDELQNEIYLKYSRTQHEGSISWKNIIGNPVENFLTKLLPELHSHNKKNQGAIDYKILLDSTLNPSTESFYYIYMLLLTASKLNRLNQAIENNRRVRLTNSYALSKLSKMQHLDQGSLFEVISRGTFNDSAVVILQDLFAIVELLDEGNVEPLIAESTPVLGASPMLGKMLSASSRNLLSIWNSIRKELRALMLSYIYDDRLLRSQGVSEVRTIDQNKISKALSKKELFKFEDVTYDSSNKTSKEILSILSDVLPGYADSADGKPGDVLESASPYVKNESFNAMVEVLVPKNLFNMRIILEFFLIFVDGSQRIFSEFRQEPVATYQLKTSYQFFEDFMKNQEVGGAYALKIEQTMPFVSGLKLDLVSLNQDSKSKIMGTSVSTVDSKLIIYENAYNFKKLFLELCLILNTSLSYREEFSGAVLLTLENFGKEYSRLYQELLSTGEVSKWMKIPVLSEISGKILFQGSQDTTADLSELVLSESKVLLHDSTYTHQEDMLDNEAYSQIVHLLLTTTWILSWLPLVKKETNYSVYDEEHNKDVKVTAVDKMKYNWSFLENGRPSINFSPDGSDILQDKTLLALRYELRCKAIYYVTMSFSHVNWSPITEPGDADHFIANLNQEIFTVDNKLSKTVSEAEKYSIFTGFSQFLNDLMISKSKMLVKINGNGIKRILLNISTLQQMLRNLSSNPEAIDFTRASLYFEMFTLNEFTLLNNMKSNAQGYTKQECLTLARLIYSEKLADGKGSQFNKGKYSELTKKIDEIVP